MRNFSTALHPPDDESPEAEKRWEEEYSAAKEAVRQKLTVSGFTDFERIGGDWYDNSIELYEVGNDVRLTEDQQRALFDEGLTTAYVNHKDGWETHYSWDHREPFKKARGWRRRYVSDPTAKTTNVIAGDANPGYYEISYWPEGWKKSLGWLKTGYMRIVPDPLEQQSERKLSAAGK